ncbi:MAG: redox-regulated ATPase YchF [Chloroflexota bacterium]|nr:redox-regulated ATPase YchF [Chloroflexota bacterium]
MKIAVIGLPKSGKTTIFNALTRGEAEVAAYSPSLVPNIGVAKVPEPRLSALENMFHPKRTVPAEVSYVDIAGSPKTFTSRGEMGGELLNYLTTADALLQVVRVFEDENLPHPEGSIDPERDIATLDLELAFSDLAIIERRLGKLEASLKGAKPQERESYLREQALLAKIKTDLDKEIPIRQQNLGGDELKMLSNYQFLTAKPMLVILNIGEQQLTQATELEGAVKNAYPQFSVIALCGKLEMELSQLSEADAREFRDTMGLAEAALDRVIRLSYQLLGLVSFFTVGSDEVKAWTVSSNTTARKAAGKVHTDIERGFIRAEVISYVDLERCGHMAEARKRGLLKLEGKDYVVRDGDIANFLFNI